MKPGKSWTAPRLSRNLSTTLPAFPSLTGRLLKIAITLDTGSTRYDDPAAADAPGHLERLQCLAHQLPGLRTALGALCQRDVDIEAVVASCEALEDGLGHPPGGL